MHLIKMNSTICIKMRSHSIIMHKRYFSLKGTYAILKRLDMSDIFLLVALTPGRFFPSSHGVSLKNSCLWSCTACQKLTTL